MKELEPSVDINEREAHHIAAAMRQVSEADGVMPEEQALIDGFVDGLPGAAPVAVDLTLFQTPALKDVFLRSLTLVALTDGSISPEEMAVIRSYAAQLGIDDKALYRMIHSTAKAMLARFEGVHVFRDQVLAIGQALGLSPEEIQETVGD